MNMVILTRVENGASRWGGGVAAYAGKELEERSYAIASDFKRGTAATTVDAWGNLRVTRSKPHNNKVAKS